MQAMKTIRCKIWKATRAKQAALEVEYDNLQLYLQTGVDDMTVCIPQISNKRIDILRR